MWIENDFPSILGAELHRPHPAYIVEMAVEPVMVHDFSAMPGEVVQLDRYRYWGKPGTKDSRERTPDQTIGTASSRNIVKDKVLVTLREYTGPADSEDPTQPSTFKIARQTLLTAQRLLYDRSQIAQFHQSIGSMTLLDDYRRWRDRVFVGELMKAEANGRADTNRGGYYFPMGKSKDAANDQRGIQGVENYAAGEHGRFSVKTDLTEVVKDMRTRNVPYFEDGYYRCIMNPEAGMHMKQDKDYREVARYSGLGVINPLQGMLQPNAPFYEGGGFGQAGMNGAIPRMPTGVLFEGVKFFESTNLGEFQFRSQIAVAGDTTPAVHDASPMLFFGPQAVGIGTGGPNASVLLNNNDDFSRFVMCIWSLYAGFEILQKDFVTVAYSFNYKVS